MSKNFQDPYGEDELNFQDLASQPHNQNQNNPNVHQESQFEVQDDYDFYADQTPPSFESQSTGNNVGGQGNPNNINNNSNKGYSPDESNINFDENVPPNPQSANPQDYKFYQVEYYRPYFDVDSKDVVVRILKTFYPFGSSFFEFIQPTPDLYGPFWIATTVVFLMAATGNFASWISAAMNNQASSWHFDFTKITSGAGTIYGYIIIMPLIIWGLCKWMEVNLTLTENLCIYGYAFFLYIPASFLLIVNVDWLRWVIMALVAAFSTAFLVRNYFTPFKSALRKGSFVIIGIAVVHCALAFAFKEVFFNNDFSIDGRNSTTTTNSTQAFYY